MLLIPAPMIITWFLLDVVRKVSIKFRVFAVPNERSSHSKIVPATGGVALLISWFLIIFMNVVFNEYPLNDDIYFYLLAGVIITIVGFYDDLEEKMFFRGYFKLGVQFLYPSLVQWVIAKA